MNKVQRLRRAVRLKRKSIIQYWMRRLPPNWWHNIAANVHVISNYYARMTMIRYAWQLRSQMQGFRHGW